MAQIARVMFDKYYNSQSEALKDSYEKAFRKYVKGMRDSKVSLILYPDANSTLRLTYGSVKSLPNDKRNHDVKRNYYTTFKTMLEKYKPGDAEFDMPKKFVEMYEKKRLRSFILTKMVPCMYASLLTMTSQEETLVLL